MKGHTYNSVYVAIAGEIVNRSSVLLRNIVLNGQESVSNPLLHIHANRYPPCKEPLRFALALSFTTLISHCSSPALTFRTMPSPTFSMIHLSTSLVTSFLCNHSGLLPKLRLSNTPANTVSVSGDTPRTRSSSSIFAICSMLWIQRKKHGG